MGTKFWKKHDHAEDASGSLPLQIQGRYSVPIRPSWNKKPAKSRLTDAQEEEGDDLYDFN
jgi:hypothetical protein